MHIRNVSDLDAYDALPARGRRKVYNELLTSDGRKRMLELRAFLGFLEASKFPVDRATVFCPDPPYPDIRSSLGSSHYFFELGEVADKDLARSYGESLKTGGITAEWYSDSEPLTSIIRSKAQKTYQTDGAPVDLLLYYWKQAPYEPEVETALIQRVGQALRSGPFSRIWVYDHSGCPSRVLYVFRG
jgi:hypothetical protein